MFKKILLGAGALLLLVIVFLVYAVHRDQQRLRAATNPCEHDCLLDSGGVDDCRQLCAQYPLTYGPATQASTH